MDKLDQKLIEIKQRRSIGLMTHVVIGYPTIDSTITIIKTMIENGVDIVELQIPFSDPLADGPTIMRACEESLRNGTKVADAFAIMEKLSKDAAFNTPLLFMAYYNTVFKYGTEKFCRDAQKAGASGLIVPDMPIDEEPQEMFLHYCKKYNLHNIHVISPASTASRLKKNAEVASGFIYCTARQGTTGAQKTLDKKITDYLGNVKKSFTIPIAVGFGISTKEQLQLLQGHADIAVVGSAIIDIINNSSKEFMYKDISEFLQNMVK